jgi:hypothetical protein
MPDTPVAAYATAEAFWRAHHEACRDGGCGSALKTSLASC